jgi:hypothetical protein
MTFRFDRTYALLTALVLAVEVVIGAFFDDRFVRPFVGDALIVVLMYFAVATFVEMPRLIIAVAVLLFAFLIETLQYFQFVNLIGLGDSRAARIVLGTTFSWLDFPAYFAGFLAILFFEKFRQNRDQ